MVNKKVNPDLSADEIIKKVQSLLQPIKTNMEQLEKVIAEVISKNKKQTTQYKAGKETVIMYLVGQVMKKINGKADAQIILKKLREKLA